MATPTVLTSRTVTSPMWVPARSFADKSKPPSGFEETDGGPRCMAQGRCPARQDRLSRQRPQRGRGARHRGGQGDATR